MNSIEKSHSVSNSAAPFDVTVVGSINVDQFIKVRRHPAPGETVLGREVTQRAGGKGANQAVAAALQGARVAMVGACGKDASEGVALTGLIESGTDISHVEYIDAPTGLAAIQVADDGENSIVVVPGANWQFTPQMVDAHAAAISNAGVVVLQGELPVDTTIRVIEVAQQAEARIIVNLAPVIDIPLELLKLVDVVMVNEHEGAELLRLWGDTQAHRSHQATAQALVNYGLRAVVMTLGADGAYLIGQGEEGVAVPSPKVDAVDTTGAGDAFAGAFAAAVSQGDSYVAAAQHAVEVAAYSVQRPGAQASYPRVC